jgi:hypothetical protein
VPYATKYQLFSLALAAPAFVAYARLIDEADPVTGTIRLKAHGFAPDDIISFEVADGGFLPSEFSRFLTYHPAPISADLFQVTRLLDGVTIDSFVNVGSGWSVALDPYARLEMHLKEASSRIDEHLTAHDPPIRVDPVTGEYPFVLVGLTCRMAARSAIPSLFSENSQYRESVEMLKRLEESDEELLKAWKAGKPIQPRPTDETPEPENVFRAQADREGSGWGMDSF